MALHGPREERLNVNREMGDADTFLSQFQSRCKWRAEEDAPRIERADGVGHDKMSDRRSLKEEGFFSGSQFEGTVQQESRWQEREGTEVTVAGA